MRVRFEVRINGRVVCVAGIRGEGVLSVMLDRVQRSPRHYPKNYHKHRANTARLVNQALQWRGLTPEEIHQGWEEPESQPVNEEVYNGLIHMTHQIEPARPGRVPERPGTPLFEGGGNWGVPGDPSCLACWPQFNSCRLTSYGEQIAQELFSRHPEFLSDGTGPSSAGKKATS